MQPQPGLAGVLIMCRADAVLRVALVIGALAGLALVATGLVFVLSPDTIIERFVGQPAAGPTGLDKK